MKFTLELKRRKGRGRPRNDVKAAYDDVMLTKQIDAGKVAGTKQESLLAAEPGSRSKKLSQLARVRSARKIEK